MKRKRNIFGFNKYILRILKDKGGDNKTESLKIKGIGWSAR